MLMVHAHMGLCSWIGTGRSARERACTVTRRCWVWQTKSICTWIFCDKNATDAFAEDSDNIMRAITIKKYVSAQTAGSKASVVLQLLCSDNRHQLTVSACGASNCQVLLVFSRHAVSSCIRADACCPFHCR